MPELYTHPATIDTPEINFSAPSRLEIVGPCDINNADTFFEPHLNWLEQYFETVDATQDFYLYIYRMTSSSNSLPRLLADTFLKAVQERKVSIRWTWKMPKSDPDIPTLVAWTKQHLAIQPAKPGNRHTLELNVVPWDDNGEANYRKGAWI